MNSMGQQESPTQCPTPTPQGGTCQNFDRDARPIFLGLKFGQILFFWIGKFFGYFSGFRKISAIFWGSDKFPAFFWVFQFLYHTLESFKWWTHGTEKHKIIVAFHIYSDFDKHCILSHSIFLGLNLESFYFFWVVDICSRTSIPVKKMLVCPPGPNPQGRLGKSMSPRVGDFAQKSISHLIFLRGGPSGSHLIEPLCLSQFQLGTSPRATPRKIFWASVPATRANFFV